MVARKIQKTWRLTIQAKKPLLVCLPMTSASVLSVVIVSPSGFPDRAGNKTRHLFGRRVGDAFVRDLAAAAQHHEPVAYREDVRDTVTDEDDGDLLILEAADEVEHLGHLPNRDGG